MNIKINRTMDKNKTINVSIDRAREWYNGSDEGLRKLALECYSSDELVIIPFEKIKCFEDAVIALNLNLDFVRSVVAEIEMLGNVHVAMYKLSTIRKALNLGQNLHVTKNPENSRLYYPCNPFLPDGCTFYEEELNSGEMEEIGKIKVEGEEYKVLGNYALSGARSGLGTYEVYVDTYFADANIGFLGCANEEIAKHFGKYFGMLITEAKYGWIDGFEVIEDKYNCIVNRQNYGY